ncbi:MAG: hypothetical protein J6127_04720 [Clostridiales bacterium]|nr:hypothetical protein [Clostridiales bacterium]
MGAWIAAAGKLWVRPKPDENMIREFIKFNKSTCPNGYSEEEIFPNTWFFDENDMLASVAGKFCEPEIWYRHMKKHFFEERGYWLDGDPLIVGEDYYDFENLCRQRSEEYDKWADRKREIEKEWYQI